MHRILPFRPWQQARCTAATGRPRSVGQILLSVRRSTVPARQRSAGETSARAGGESRPTQKKRRSVAPDSHRCFLTFKTFSLAVASLLRPCASREKLRAITHSAMQVPTRDRTGVRVNAGEAAVGAPYSDRAAALGRAVLHEH